jgi:hypothetical protein
LAARLQIGLPVGFRAAVRTPEVRIPVASAVARHDWALDAVGRARSLKVGRRVLAHAYCRNVSLVGWQPDGASAFRPNIPARGVCSYQNVTRGTHLVFCIVIKNIVEEP